MSSFCIVFWTAKDLEEAKQIAKIQATIKENSSYDVPEILEIAIQDGLKSYLDWIEKVTV